MTDVTVKDQENWLKRKVWKYSLALIIFLGVTFILLAMVFNGPVKGFTPNSYAVYVRLLDNYPNPLLTPP